MRSSCRVVAQAALRVLGGASASRAQEWGWTPDGGRAQGWVFTPSVGMGGAWDDNVLLVHPADRPPPDCASPISPALSLDYTDRRSQLSTGYRRAYVDGRFSWFQNDPLAVGQPKLRTLSASSILGYRATRWLSAAACFVRTQQDSQIAGGQLARNQLGFRLVAARPVRLH